MGYWEKFNNRVDNHIHQGTYNQVRALGEVIPIANLFWWEQISKRKEIQINGPYSNMYVKKTHENQTIELHYNRHFYEGELKRMHILNKIHAEAS